MMAPMVNATALSIGLATSAAVAGGGYIYWHRNKTTLALAAKYSCRCGKVQANLVVPPANHSYNTNPVPFQCCCRDCVGFVDKVLSRSQSTLSTDRRIFNRPGAPYLVMYTSEIQLTSGEEFIKAVKISPKTMNVRFYATCCNTPLGMTLTYAPWLTYVYTPNIVEGQDVLSIKPKAIVYYDKRIHDKPDPYSEDEEVYKYNSNQFPGNLVKLLFHRWALLSILGERGPGTGFPFSWKNVDIGPEDVDKS